MKKTMKFALALAMAGLLLPLAVSCGEEKKSKDTSVEKTQESARKEKKIRTMPAVVLLDDASLWTLNEENKMVWAKKSLSIGQFVECIQSDTGDGTGLGPVEKQKFIRVSNGKEAEREFIPVLYEGEKLWVQDALVALDAEPAILLEDKIIFNEADILEITEKKLPSMTYVALHTSFTSPDFYKITAYTDNYGKLSEVYIKKEAIAEKEKNITAVALAKKIRSLEDKYAEDSSEETETIIEELYDDFDLMGPTVETRTACAEAYNLVRLLEALK